MSHEESGSGQQYVPYNYGPYYPYGSGQGASQESYYYPYDYRQGAGQASYAYPSGFNTSYPYDYRSECLTGAKEILKGRTPDQWVQFISPLVDQALEEVKEGINAKHLFQEYIVSGVLVGLGYSPKEAIEIVEKWEKSGTSRLLKQSKQGK